MLSGDWGQELLALGISVAALGYIVGRFIGPRRPKPEKNAPNAQLSERLKRGLESTRKDR